MTLRFIGPPNSVIAGHAIDGLNYTSDSAGNMLVTTPTAMDIRDILTAGFFCVGAAADNEIPGQRAIVAQITGPTVTVTPTGGSATTYKYTVAGVYGNGYAPGTGSTTAGVATLTAAAFNTLTWLGIPGVTAYKVWRTTGGSTQGLIATITIAGNYNQNTSYASGTIVFYNGQYWQASQAVPAQVSAATGTTISTTPASGSAYWNIYTFTVVDTGLAGDASTAPSFNNTAMFSSGLQDLVQSIGGTTPAVAITNPCGSVIISSSGVAVLTLALPIAGAPAAGGMDGCKLTILDSSGHAHTVTTPTNGLAYQNALVGNDHIATFGGTAANALVLIAFGGVWIVQAAGACTFS